MVREISQTAFADFIEMNDDWSEEAFKTKKAGDALAGTLCTQFRHLKNDFVVALLANSTHDLEQWSNKAGEFVYFKWRIRVPPAMFAEYKREQELCYEKDIRSFEEMARTLGGSWFDDIREIIVEPTLEKDPNWRLGAQDYLSGAGINNQGNVYSTNRPRIVFDELYFRRIEEQYLYEALLNRHIPVMPLPVVLRADGKKRPNGTSRRIEPDFCLLYKGRLVILEVDGGSHQESPADAEERLRFLRENGAVVHRVSASRCDDIEKARVALSDVLRSIDKEIGARP